MTTLCGHAARRRWHAARRDAWSCSHCSCLRSRNALSIWTTPSTAVYLISNELEMSTVRPDCEPNKQPSTGWLALPVLAVVRIWWSLRLMSTSCSSSSVLIVRRMHGPRAAESTHCSALEPNPIFSQIMSQLPSVVLTGCSLNSRPLWLCFPCCSIAANVQLRGHERARRTADGRVQLLIFDVWNWRCILRCCWLKCDESREAEGMCFG